MTFNNRQQILLLLVILSIGIAAGWLGFLIFGDMAGNCKVLYVSQAEIVDFEKARIEREKSPNMFYGQIDKAIDYIKQEARTYGDKRHKVILTTDKHLGGGKSISLEVYKKVIAKLKKAKEVSGSASRNTVVDP